MDLDRLSEVAMQAAREAGELSLAHLGKPGRTKWKRSQDIVTPGMLEVQGSIIENIQAAFPDHAILSEELDDAPDPDAESLWIIDPIDGSLNFMKGIPFYAVSIGFQHKGVHRLGVVFDPCRDELFHALYRRGAFLNGRPIFSHKVSDGAEAFQSAVVATDWPAQPSERTNVASIVSSIAGDVVSVQILGSPVLAMCYIAVNRLNSYFHLHLKPWDVAAAVVILEESGGTFTNIEGSAWQHSDGGYLASDGIIHGRMLSPIRHIIRGPKLNPNLRKSP